MKIEYRYLDGSYLRDNPDWDRDDSPWKAKKIISFLHKCNLEPKSFCEIGCGAGDILDNLSLHYIESTFHGYDISPHLESFWNSKQSRQNIHFHLADFHNENKARFNLILMIDVFEHLRDPFTFLENTIPHGDYFLFHIPLDLNAFNVMRGYPLMKVREKVGHLHYYTKDLALQTLIDSGYNILNWEYTNAYKNIPNPKLSTLLGLIPRFIISKFSLDYSARLLGGQTLLVLADAKNPKASRY